MTDDDLRAELDRLRDPNVEGDVPHMYLDDAKPPHGPNVTTGIGFLLASLTDAHALPWVHGVDHSPASAGEVAREYLRVNNMPGGLPAGRYKGPLVLLPADVDAEGLRRLRAMADGLRNEFVGFETFPGRVQQCLLDLRWNVGSLMRWRGLRIACNSMPPDWQAAARECTVTNPDNRKLRALRNQWRQSCFTSQLGTG
jgi:hypothetical protein